MYLATVSWEIIAGTYSWEVQLGKMINHLFVTATGQLQARWLEVFPSAVGQSGFDGLSLSKPKAVIWMEWPATPSDTHYRELNLAVLSGCPVVVLSPSPSELQCQTAVSLGAKGYCHSHASAKQLKEVSAVVKNGGLWLGPQLLQKLIAGAASAGVSEQISKEQPANPIMKLLTERERKVGMAVAAGKTNREIAEQFHISERTVKSHLTTIFNKTSTRDRVHLALLLNNVQVDH
ncbi:hypothetical protein NBRC116493_27650 [Aurantivibrio infirmus]